MNNEKRNKKKETKNKNKKERDTRKQDNRKISHSPNKYILHLAPAIVTANTSRGRDNGFGVKVR